MTLEEIRVMLGWCTIINSALLIFMWFGLMLARDFVYRLHLKMFRLSASTMDVIVYSAIGLFKLTIIVFNLTPYVALRIMG